MESLSLVCKHFLRSLEHKLIEEEWQLKSEPLVKMTNNLMLQQGGLLVEGSAYKALIIKND